MVSATNQNQKKRSRAERAREERTAVRSMSKKVSSSLKDQADSEPRSTVLSNHTTEKTRQRKGWELTEEQRDRDEVRVVERFFSFLVGRHENEGRRLTVRSQNRRQNQKKTETERGTEKNASKSVFGDENV